jgi:hypothetical protein
LLDLETVPKARPRLSDVAYCGGSARVTPRPSRHQFIVTIRKLRNAASD